MRIINIIGVTLSTVVISVMVLAYIEAVEAEERTLKDQELGRVLECVATNIYHEARSESRIAQKAVAFVVLNRVRHHRYPDNPCDVVYEGVLDENNNPVRNQCQFSWFCDGKPDGPVDMDAWTTAREIALDVILNYGKKDDPVEGAVMYHASYVNPYWADHYKITVRIDNHIFYK